jgi:hypothetical protein
MKTLLFFIMLLGFFAYTDYAQDTVNKDLNISVAQIQAQAVDTPATPVKWVDENLWSLVSGVGLLVYEFLALKIPTSKTVSIVGNLYKLLTFFIGDKSKKGDNFKIN